MGWRAASTKWTCWWKPKRRNRTNNSFCSLSTQYVPSMCVCMFVCSCVIWLPEFSCVFYASRYYFPSQTDSIRPNIVFSFTRTCVGAELLVFVLFTLLGLHDFYDLFCVYDFTCASMFNVQNRPATAKVCFLCSHFGIIFGRVLRVFSDMDAFHIFRFAIRA